MIQDPEAPTAMDAGLALDLALSGVALGWEAAAVVSLRLAVLARGGPDAQVELGRMVGEKLLASAMLPLMAATGQMGVTAPAIALGALDHLRRKVRANHRRLLAASPREGDPVLASSLGITP